MAENYPEVPLYPELPGDSGGSDPGGSPGGNTGLNAYGCPGNEVKIALDVNGRPGPEECMDQSEATRRNQLWIASNPGNTPERTGGTSPQLGGGPSAPRGPAQFKFEPVPQFEWGEVFAAPSLEDAKKEPGYQFAADEGRRALEASKAAKGVLRTGGTLKDILGWGNKFAEQNYGGVFDRYARGYDARYQAAKDKYSPNLLGWQTRTAFGTNAALQAWNRSWDDYWRNTLSASDIFNAGQS